MFKTIINAWKIADLRKKILFTALILIIYRFGNAVPIPFINASALSQMFTSQGENAFYGYLNLLTGGSFTAATVFALSITPYINASIIIQLLTMAIPALERMVKEGGEEGKEKQAKITRYTTVVLGIIEGFVYYLMLKNNNVIDTNVFFTNATLDKICVALAIIMTFTAGTAVIMWMGELITSYGIGNGISMILFAGIISRMPNIFASAITMVKSGELSLFVLIPMVVATIFLFGFVVFISNAERRITVQYAKRVVGKKIYGGQSSYIPLKVNMTGVLPVIFRFEYCVAPVNYCVVLQRAGNGLVLVLLFKVYPVARGYLHGALLHSHYRLLVLLRFCAVQPRRDIKQHEKQRRICTRAPSGQADGEFHNQGYEEYNHYRRVVPRVHRDLAGYYKRVFG